MTIRRASTRVFRTDPARGMKRSLELVAEPAANLERPRTRGDCEGGSRPCPFVGCAHNTFLHVNEATGAITYEQGEKEPWEVTPETSCVLDVADSGGLTLDHVAKALGGLTRERSRQIEAKALASIRRKGVAKLLVDYVGHESAKPPTMMTTDGGGTGESVDVSRRQLLTREFSKKDQAEIDQWVDDKYATLGMPDPRVIEEAIPERQHAVSMSPYVAPSLTPQQQLVAHAIAHIREHGPKTINALCVELNVLNQTSLKNSLYGERTKGKVRSIVTEQGTFWYVEGQTPPSGSALNDVLAGEPALPTIQEALKQKGCIDCPVCTKVIDPKMMVCPHCKHDRGFDAGAATARGEGIPMGNECRGYAGEMMPTPPRFDQEAETQARVVPEAPPSSQQAIPLPEVGPNYQAIVAKARRRIKVYEAFHIANDRDVFAALEEMLGLDALEELGKLRR